MAKNGTALSIGQQFGLLLEVLFGMAVVVAGWFIVKAMMAPILKTNIL